MKFTISKDVLLDGLQKVQSIVGAKSTLPVLFNVQLRAEKDTLTLTATDLEVTVRAVVSATVQRAGGTTLPARRLVQIVRELPAAEVEVEVDEKDQATLRSGNSEFRVFGVSEDEFPPLPKFQGGKEYSIEQATLKRMLNATYYAASTDEGRFILMSVLLSFREGKLSVVATDGRRMAHMVEEVEMDRAAEGDHVVPAKTVNELLKTLGDEGAVKVHVLENQTAFEFGNMLIVSKLMEGTYPNFRQVIPDRCEERVTLPREDFLNAVRRVSLMASDKASSVTLAFAKNKVEISAVTPNIGEARETMALKYSGKDLAIAFNPDFIMDPLKNLAVDEVYLEMSDELSAGVMKCNAPFLYVMMPMRVR
jgi:DNA polymerase III subunit beta